MKTSAIDLKPLLLLFGLLYAVYVATQPGQAPSLGSPAPAVAEVGIDEARALIDAGAVVIDVRERATSASAHLPGALLIPLEVLAARRGELEAAKAQAKTIVVYCGDGSTRGPEAAHRLTQAGFPSVVNLKPGFSGWRDAGLPVKTS